MTYSTMMVHLDVGSANDDLLCVTADLVERFQANVIGIAACQAMQMSYGDAYVSGEVIEIDRTELNTELCEAEASFRAALVGKGRSSAWRSSEGFTLVADYVAHEGRAADLLITSPDQGWSAVDSSRRMNVAEVVLHIGRPVLIVSRGVKKLNFEKVTIGWKESRGARRAISDALPFLRRADDVTVVEIAAKEEIEAARQRLQDVVAWLERHSIAAKSLAAISIGDDAKQLDSIAGELGAGLLVAGAYGHTRFREWALGGVTRNLLLHSSRCTLLSH
jgi:nucleotide-binding universal stress UspA family protein